jgi:2,4-dienoyl-CoA reductase-like NADH-dependent reductase (Old Yellow Enzyme family)
MAKLFSPLKIRDLTLKNRIVMSPMCQYSATDGYASEWHLVHYGTRAAGGTGLIIMEATAVSPEGRISPGDLGLWDDKHIERLKQITGFIHSQGSVAGIQIAHAGRKASCAVPLNGSRQLALDEGGWQTIAPSGIPFNEGERMPSAMSKNDILQITDAFRSAASRALKAGFSVLEIHSAHGYLLHEFLSPLTNKRNDEYGGSFENRTRFLLEVVSAVRTVWPVEKPLFVRLSATDWTEGGWTPEETIRIAPLLKLCGVDLIDCSSGGIVGSAKIPAGPGYQVPFAGSVRKTGIMTSAVGFITGQEQAEEILMEEKADLVLLGRELLRNPYFALNAAKETGEDIKWPDQYLRGK